MPNTPETAGQMAPSSPENPLGLRRLALRFPDRAYGVGGQGLASFLVQIPGYVYTGLL
jgi:hypothetical protein